MSAQQSEANRPAQAELDAATIAAWTARSRERAGVPRRITDPTVLAKVVTLALGAGLPNASSADGRT